MIEMNDPLKQLAEMKIEIEQDKENCWEIRLPNGLYFLNPQHGFLARAIEQLPNMAEITNELERRLRNNMESWGSDIIGLSYRKGQPGLIGNRIFDINAAIRGPESESKEDRLRRALEEVDRELKSQQTNFDYIDRISKIVDKALEAK